MKGDFIEIKKYIFEIVKKKGNISTEKLKDYLIKQYDYSETYIQQTIYSKLKREGLILERNFKGVWLFRFKNE